jgi:hypothetical protein
MTSIQMPTELQIPEAIATEQSSNPQGEPSYPVNGKRQSKDLSASYWVMSKISIKLGG